MAQQQQQQQHAASGEPELAGARPIISVAHVIEAVSHRVQSQFAELLGDLPAQPPDARCVSAGFFVIARARAGDVM